MADPQSATCGSIGAKTKGKGRRLCFFFSFHHLLSAVVTALDTHTVVGSRLTRLWINVESRGLQLDVSSALVATSLRYFPFRMGHRSMYYKVQPVFNCFLLNL